MDFEDYRLLHLTLSSKLRTTFSLLYFITSFFFLREPFSPILFSIRLPKQGYYNFSYKKSLLQIFL